MENIRKQSNKDGRIRRVMAEVKQRLSSYAARLTRIEKRDIDKLVQELLIRQVDLEMQCEELDGKLMRYFKLYDEAPVGYLTISEKGTILEANFTAATLLGLARGMLVKQRITKFILEEDRHIFYACRKQLFETGTPQECEMRVVPNGGWPYWAQLEATTTLDAKSEPVLHIILSDITERKKAENMLAVSELKYRRIVETSMEGILQTNVDFKITYINQRTREMLGYPGEEMLGQSLQKLIFDEDITDHLKSWDERRKGISARIERRLKRKDGSAVWVFISSTVIKDEKGQFGGTFALLTDITERRKLEEEMQKIAKLESVGTLAGSIAHDFNNILTAILGNISLARMEAAPGSELHESLEAAEKASLRAKDLTQKLLTFSKGGAPVKKLASLSELVKDTAGFALRGSNVKCQFIIPADLWHAEIDAGQVSQVIHNLVINAQQAMPLGGTIEITADNISPDETKSLGRGLPLEKGDYIRIAVADHGTGIPPVYLDKIFDPFFTTKAKHSGLGLATSLSIARQHGGHLSVESQVGVGSTFYLYLPASVQTSITEHDNKESIRPLVGARVLVMDDEEVIRMVADRILRHIGYEDTSFAADGAEAIRLYSEAMKDGRPFGAVILDLTIPGGMGGKETIKKLLEIDPRVKAIVSSGYAADPVVANYREYGYSGAVAKPYTMDQLGSALHELLVQV